MTQQEEIRQQQLEQMAAPRKPYERLLQFISNVFHPLFSLTFGALIICYYTPFSILSFAPKAFFVGVVFFFTALLPAIIISILHLAHIIGHWALRDVRDRTIPFLTNIICYFTCFMVLRRFRFLPDWVLMPYFGSVILTVVAWVVSFWWKISAHASGNAACATLIMLLYYYVPDQMPLWLLFGSIILTGLICSIRLYLGRHTLAQVGAGALLGIVCMLIGSYFYF